MKSLNEYIPIQESLGTSDEAILYRLGIYVLNAMEPSRIERVKKRYHLPGSGRAGVLKYMRENSVPVLDRSEELIPRRSWDLDSLYGETELQLMHPDYYKATNLMLKQHKRKHDVLTIFQCSSKKPYNTNLLYTSDITKPYGEFSDFACISNPGIVPYEFSGHYPFRYDEWSVTAEQKLKDILNMTHKYRIVNLCRLCRFKRETGYKKIISFIPNPMKNWVFDTAIKYNVDGAKDWCAVTITDELFKRCQKAYPQLGGLIKTRLIRFPMVINAYLRHLKKVTDDKEGLEKAIKKRHEELKESLDEPKYRMMKSITYTEVMDKFKKSIKDNMEDPSVDKGSNNLLYKSYYWTCLDLLLIGLDGNLVEDIDHDYWDLMEKLGNDKDFVKIGKFLFAYKPLLENDDIKESDIEQEALKLKLTQGKVKIALDI